MYQQIRLDLIILNFRFDMAVNGGGGVTLQFQRSPLKATTRTLYLAWNKIVVISPVIMTPHGTSGRVHSIFEFLGSS